MRFENPANGYVETCTVPFLWALIFGPFYFVLKGVWRHVVLYFVVNSVIFIAWCTIWIVASSASLMMLGFAAQQDPNAIRNAIAIATLIVPVTIIAPFLLYPFIAGGIVRRHFLRQGWIELLD